MKNKTSVAYPDPHLFLGSGSAFWLRIRILSMFLDTIHKNISTENCQSYQGAGSGSAPFPPIQIRILVTDPDPLNVFRYHTQKYFNRKFSVIKFEFK